MLSVVLISGCGGGSDDPSWRLQASTDFGRMPKWSADGAMLLFGNDNTGTDGIWIWDMMAEPSILSIDLLPHGWDYDWAPNGSMVAFSSPGSTDSSGVWIYHLEGDSLQRILNRGSNVSWFADGQSIAVQLPKDGGTTAGIHELSISDGTITFLAAGIGPNCSPTGDRFLFLDKDLEGRLYLYENDTAEPLSDDIGIIQYNWASHGDVVCWLLNKYTTGRLNGELYELTLGNEPLLIKSSVTSPTINYDGSKVCYTMITTGIWDGTRVLDFNSGEQMVDADVINPQYAPNRDAIAANLINGGIRVFEFTN